MIQIFVDMFIWVVENWETLLNATLRHLYLSIVALFFSIIIGVPIGILITKNKRIAELVISFTNLGQMLPFLALLALMLPLLGTGMTPAIVALFIKVILPIVKNTYVGIINVDKTIIESAKGMGMKQFQILLKVELPLGFPVIMTGIRTSFVLTISFTTLATLIAAGGLGDIIFLGIQLMKTDVLLAGSITAMLLAIGSNSLLLWLENRFTPVHLRERL